jgi:HEAT repeat protein
MDANPDVQILIKNVTDISSTERVNSINALGAMKCVEACECFNHVLRDRDRQVRMSALRALENIREPVYPQIVAGLKYGSADVRELAADVLEDERLLACTLRSHHSATFFGE